MGLVKWTASVVVLAAVLVGQPGPSGATATVRHVALTGSDTGDCISTRTPCRTINYAVAQAVGGDTVIVGPGRYPEEVVVDKPLRFRGANAGRPAGVSPAVRLPATVVRGFRSPGSPYPTEEYAFRVSINGFTIAPQGDAGLIAGGPVPHHLVSLFGGSWVSVRNNVFQGGPFVPDCSYTCTTMTDFALLVQSGRFEIRDNTFVDFRRPVDISQNTAAFPITEGSVSGNAFRHITSRAIWIREGDCYGPTACGGGAVDTMAGIRVSGNVFDGTGAQSPVTGGPAGLVLTTSGNVVTGNVFRGDDPGVFAQVCDPANHPTPARNSFTSNQFRHNVDGIFYFAVDTGSCPAAVNARISRNSFVHNTGFGVRWYPEGTAPNELDARCNWWGAAAGPGSVGADEVTAQVLATPWNVATPYAPGVCLGH